MKRSRQHTAKSSPEKKKISVEPLQNLRGSNSNESVPPQKKLFVDHGLEESPVEARARFHSELLKRVREEHGAKQPVAKKDKKKLLETIDVWEESLWSGVDEKPKS